MINEELTKIEKKYKDLEIQVSQLKHAIRATQKDSLNCNHGNSTYNGEASWCLSCGRIWLVEDVIKNMKLGIVKY